MDKKNLIISKLECLKEIYSQNEDKKWNLRALSIAINSIKKYNGIIISGDQLKNELKGIGEKISKRVDEILETGNLKELDILNKEDNLENLLLITGVGNVRAKKWLSLNIKNINDVKNAIKEKQITITHHIDIGIKYYDDFKKKIPKNEIDEIKSYLKDVIQKIDNNLLFEICGSYRRGAIESGDIDILISHKNYLKNIEKYNILKNIVNILTQNNFIIDNLTSKGNTKFMGVCKINEIARRIDIRVVDYSSYYSSLLYFTGNKNFNVYLRNKALENNFSLSEYFLKDLNSEKEIFLKSEKEIFDILKISYLTPKERNIE
jgi:DNA polymerase beta